MLNKRLSKEALAFSICLMLTASSLSCQGEKKKGNDPSGEDIELFTSGGDTIAVEIERLSRAPFDLQIVSHGKLRAEKMATLRFEDSQAPIERLYVKNGQRVSKGQRIASIDERKARLELERSKEEYKQRDLELQELLVGMGYDPNDRSKIPADRLELAYTKSGFRMAMNKCKQAELNLEQIHLLAPISGRVSDLNTQEHSIPELGKPLCHIIGDGGFEVVFDILESELAAIRLGGQVEVLPLALRDVKATALLQEINPIVDDRGMVQLRARLQNPAKEFLVGMNVELRIAQRLEDRLVIPKRAVVLRSDKPVVFSVRDGKAAWNYVDIEAENSEYYCIQSKTLEEGQEIVVDGNANLAHDAPLKLRHAKPSQQ